MHLVWFTWSLVITGIWGIIWFSLKSTEIRKGMLTVSLWTSLTGLIEPLFVPAYWNPPSLFDLAQTTGFDIESLIFTFAIGGLGFALYLRVFPITHEDPVRPDERIAARHKYHLPLLFSTPVLFIILFAARVNPIYAASAALMTGGVATWYCRPDLKKKMFVSAFLFTGLYFTYFLSLVILVPGYVVRVWNMPALSGILVAGIPAEELMFAFSFGFYWSTVYEHSAWKKLPEEIRHTG